MRVPLVRLGLVAAGTALAVGLGFGVAELVGGADPATAPSRPAPTAARGIPATESLEARTAGLDRLLAARNTAIARHDLAGWMATVDPLDTAFAAQQRALFTTIQALPVASWSYRDGGPGPQLSAAAAAARGAQDAWIARIVLTYRLAGFDRADITRQQFHTVVLRDGRWFLAGTADAAAAGQPSQVDVWDLGPTTVVRGARSLVVGRLPVAQLRALAAVEDRAVAAVDQIWTAPWSRRVVLIVPASLAEMKLLAGDSGPGLDQIAALTTGERVDGTVGTEDDRVLLNPAAFARLSPLGKRVVLTHETTHVATRAITRTFPVTWLSEGFADYVGYRGTGLPVGLVAQDALAQVRAGKMPAELPIDQDFDPATGDVSPAYAEAWLACRLIAERWGEARLVAFYRTVAGSDSGEPAAALAQGWALLGTSGPAFVKAWQAELRAEAGR